MATDKREIVTDLLARNKMGPATKSAADDLDKVGRAADKAGDKAEDFGKASVLAGEGAEKLGKESGQAARHVDQLQDEIDNVNRELVKLAGLFAAAGSAGERLDISKAIRRTQTDLRRLTTSKDILKDAIPDMPDVGKQLTKSITGALSKSKGLFAAMGPEIGIALGAAMGPPLLGALSAAVTAGVGGAGLGAGLALAVASDSRIRIAGDVAGKRFLDGMQDAAKTGLAEPILRSVNILSAAGDRITAKWASTFHILGDSVVPLTKDIVTGVERINTAITNVASKSGPAIAALGDSFILIADGASDFIESLSASKSATDALTVLAGVLGNILTGAGKAIEMIDKFFSSALPTNLPTQFLSSLAGWYKDTANEASNAAPAIQSSAKAMTEAELAARGNADGIAALNTELRKQADPVFALRENQMKLAEAQGKSAEAVKKHGANSREAREATRNLAKAALDLQGSVGALGKDFDGKLTPAMRATFAAAGLTKRQISDVEGEFGRARKAGNSYAQTYTAATKVVGSESARRSLFSVRDAANSIDRAVYIAVRITGDTNLSRAKAAINKNMARAGGGPIEAGRPYWVGEEGPELVVPSSSGTVMTASASRRMVSGIPTGRSAGSMGSRGGGGGTTRVQFDVTGAETKFKAWLREWIRTGGVLT